MDLNIIVLRCNENGEQKDNPMTIINKIKTAIKWGFELVALNVVIDSSRLKGKEMKIPKPLSIVFEKSDKGNGGLSGRRFRVLSRLTAIVDDPIQVHKLMQLPVTKKYDILALQPQTEKLFQHVCSIADVDIISLDLTAKLPFILRRQQIGVAIQRGLFFEIQYAPCIRDSTTRQSMFAMGQTLVTTCKGKNIILSSGAINVFDLRAPKDVANLGELFGMQQNLARQAVLDNCKKVIRHSDLRKTTGQAIVSMTSASSLPETEAWVVAACDVPEPQYEQSGNNVHEELKPLEKVGLQSMELDQCEKAAGIQLAKQKKTEQIDHDDDDVQLQPAKRIKIEEP